MGNKIDESAAETEKEKNGAVTVKVEELAPPVQAEPAKEVDTSVVEICDKIGDVTEGKENEKDKVRKNFLVQPEKTADAEKENTVEGTESDAKVAKKGATEEELAMFQPMNLVAEEPQLTKPLTYPTAVVCAGMTQHQAGERRHQVRSVHNVFLVITFTKFLV